MIWNRSRATATNSYLLLYPKEALEEALNADPGLCRRVLFALRRIPKEQLLGAGRTYGGGLFKIEPRELARLSVNTFLTAREPRLGSRGKRGATWRLEPFCVPRSTHLASRRQHPHCHLHLECPLVCRWCQRRIAGCQRSLGPWPKRNRFHPVA